MEPNRRELFATTAGAALFSSCIAVPSLFHSKPPTPRDDFPRLETDVYLNAAGGTPLSTFAENGLRRFEFVWRNGDGGGEKRWARVREMLAESRALFAGLIGAKASEIALVPSTTAGEQIVLDGLDVLTRKGINVVTNDHHFAGSLHNLIGLQRAGVEVRIVKGDRRDVALEDMKAAIDANTALVCVTLVSNVNGRIEPMKELAAHAHANGALVYADVIQAAGIVPFDVNELGIDFAACGGYKWLFGPHGTGFLYVKEEHQGGALRDRVFPGAAVHDYAPWVETPVSSEGDFAYHAPTDASRYEPGNPNYLGYSALHAGLSFVTQAGVPRLLEHSLFLAKRLKEQLDPERYPCLSPHADRSPILAFAADPERVAPVLEDAGIEVSLWPRHIRVSPAVYNQVSDVDRLAHALNEA